MTGTETRYMTIQHIHIWNRIQLSLRKKKDENQIL